MPKTKEGAAAAIEVSTRPSKRKLQEWRQGYLFLTPAVVILGIFIGIAAVFVVYLSFHKVNLFTDSYTFVGLENYTRLFTDNMARTALTNTLQKFTNITIPYLKPITTYVLLTGIIGTLQMFDQAYIFSNGSGGPANSTLTVSLLVYRYAFGPNNAMGYAATIAIILAAVIMIVSMIAEKLNSHRADPALGGQHRQHLPDAAVLHQLPQGRV